MKRIFFWSLLCIQFRDSLQGFFERSIEGSVDGFVDRSTERSIKGSPEGSLEGSLEGPIGIWVIVWCFFGPWRSVGPYTYMSKDVFVRIKTV